MSMVERARIVLACLVRKGNSASSAASWRVGSYGLQVAKPICPRWDWRFTGSSAQRQTADLRCRLSHPCAGFAGAGSPGRASTMGRPRGSQTVGSQCARGVAGAAPGGDLPPAPAHLVCKHRSGACRQGRRGGGVVFESTPEHLGPQCRREAQHPGPSGYVETDSGAIVRALKSTYKRNGTLNLFAALEIASGQVFAQTTEQKKREDFRRFLDAVVAELPPDKEIHVILDNYCTHKRNADWLDKYQGRVQFHFTPTSASWLNQVEIWFGLLTRKALRGASFAYKDQLRSAIESFVAKTNQHPKPFHWRKREVKGSQLRNTIINVRN